MLLDQKAGKALGNDVDDVLALEKAGIIVLGGRLQPGTVAVKRGI